MKRSLLLFWLVVLLILRLEAQAPPGINYQGVARDPDGKPFVSKMLSIRISILKNSASGDVEFAEVHPVTTNQFGLFTLIIGQGSVLTGSFGFVSWAVGNKWLQVEMDVDGGNNYQLMGTQQLMSVPYAFYSQYSGNGLLAGQGISITNGTINNTGDADNSATNELITGLSFGADNKIKITDAGGTHEADLTPLASQNLSHVLSASNDAGSQRIINLGAPTSANDASTKTYVDNHIDGDADPVNEIQDLALTGNILKVTNNASATNISLSPYLDNTDAQTLSLSGTTLAILGGNNVNLAGINTDSQNLVIGAPSGTSRTINISGGTGVTFDVADNDNNPTNEIQDLTLTSNVLKVTNNASASNINLAPYLDNTDAQTLSLSGTTLAILGGNSVSLAGINTDAQNLSLGAPSGTSRTINISGGTGITIDVADNDNLPTNEAQTLSKASNVISLTNVSGVGGGSVTLNDDDPLNEIQDLSLTSNSLKVTNNASATSISLLPYLDNTDGQTLSMGTVSGTVHPISITGGNTISLDVADNDNNPTNEIQDLTLTSNILKVTNNASATSISLAPYLDNTDNQILTYTAATNNLAIGNGNSVTVTQTLNQVLSTSNDAGAHKITNIAAPTASSDAATKKYVDDADNILSSRISTTYAFKTAFSYTNTGSLAENNRTLPFTTEDFDDFNVLASNSFTASEDGTYVFIVDGSYAAALAGGQLSLLYNSVKYPIAIVQPWGGVQGRFNATLMFKMTIGQAVTLVGDNILVGGQFTGGFFGYKL